MHLKSKLTTYLIIAIISSLTVSPSYAWAKNKNLRIISISPAATEILYAIGAGESVVAVSSYCNWPQEVKSKKKIGSFTAPNIEEIIYLDPDIVIASGLEQAPIVQQLRALNIKTIVCFPKSIAELFETITKIAKAVNKVDEGQKLIKAMSAKIKKIKSRFQDIPIKERPKVLIELWDEPLIVAGTQSIVGQLIELAGGRNIAYDAVRAYSRFSYELVLKRDPDYVICVYMQPGQSKERIKARFGFEYINAAKNNHIIWDINPDIILRAGPRIHEAIDEINRRIYEK